MSTLYQNPVRRTIDSFHALMSLHYHVRKGILSSRARDVVQQLVIGQEEKVSGVCLQF